VGEEHALRLAHRPGGEEQRERRRGRVPRRRGREAPRVAGEEVLPRDDALVEPRVLGVHGHDQPQVGQLLQQVVEQLEEVHSAPRGRHHHRGHLGLPELVLELEVGEGGVERDEGQSEPRPGERGDDPLEAVGEVEPALGERRRQCVHLGRHLPPRPPRAAIHDEDGVRTAAELLLEGFREVGRRHDGEAPRVPDSREI
jgi:hypothetical protein